MASLEASAQRSVAPSLEWGTGSIKLGGRENVGGGSGLQGEVYFTFQRPLAPDNNLSLHLGQRQTARMGEGAPAWELGALVT